MKRNIRGYCLDIAITVLRHRVEFNIHPLAWNKPMLCVPKKNTMSDSWHFNLGCLHIWGMGTDKLLALELDFNYCHFWWDKPKCPANKTQIF